MAAIVPERAGHRRCQRRVVLAQSCSAQQSGQSTSIDGTPPARVRAGCRPRRPYDRGVIDLRLVRENPDLVRASQRARGADESLVDELLAADAARREAVKRADDLRAEQ